MALRRTRTVLFGLTGLAVAGGMAGLGTFATFTDTTAASNTISTGTVDIELGESGANNRLSTAATGMVPGDSMQRRLKLLNVGTEDVAAIVLTTEATATSLLDTDATNGLQVKLERCSGLMGWREVASGSTYTYTCDQLALGDNLGTRPAVLARRAIVGGPLTLTNTTSTTAGATDDMVLTVDLPSTAGNAFQDISSTIEYTFDVTQRAAAEAR